MLFNASPDPALNFEFVTAGFYLLWRFWYQIRSYACVLSASVRGKNYAVGVTLKGTKSDEMPPQKVARKVIRAANTIGVISKGERPIALKISLRSDICFRLSGFGGGELYLPGRDAQSRLSRFLTGTIAKHNNSICAHKKSYVNCVQVGVILVSYPYDRRGRGGKGMNAKASHLRPMAWEKGGVTIAIAAASKNQFEPRFWVQKLVNDHSMPAQPATFSS
jgi:hypothetical protein